MKQIIALVMSNKQVMPQAHLIWLQAPEIAGVARPGQFVMVRCGYGHDPLLRRPLSIHKVTDNGQIALLFNIVGKGTRWLSNCNQGDAIDLLGPLGNGFFRPPASRRLLLVAGGLGIAPLVFLAEKALTEGCSVKLILGAQTASLLYPRSLLPSSVELIIATEDGSAGRNGMATEFISDFVLQTDCIFACGPSSMYQSMIAQDYLKGKPVQISLEMRMGCGLGACYGCTIKTKEGMRQVCQDGPVFDLDNIL